MNTVLRYKTKGLISGFRKCAAGPGRYIRIKVAPPDVPAYNFRGSAYAAPSIKTDPVKSAQDIDLGAIKTYQQAVRRRGEAAQSHTAEHTQKADSPAKQKSDDAAPQQTAAVRHTDTTQSAAKPGFFKRNPNMGKILWGGGSTIGLGAIIAALIRGGGQSLTAASSAGAVGPAKQRKQPPRRYKVFDQAIQETDKSYGNVNWYRKQLQDTSRAGTLSAGARQQAKAKIPQHLRFKQVLGQTFLDPTKLSGRQVVSRARLRNAARQQAKAWLQHLGIQPTQYNVRSMQQYFRAYMDYNTRGGIKPNIKRYFSHLPLSDAQALSTLQKWQNAVSSDF